MHNPRSIQCPSLKFPYIDAESASPDDWESTNQKFLLKGLNITPKWVILGYPYPLTDWELQDSYGKKHYP
jgi:hypothetical protein